MRLPTTIGIILLAALTTCVEPFDFEPESFERVLVVEGAFTDQDRPQLIQLSYTYPIQSHGEQSDPVKDARVKIIATTGAEFEFIEIGDGQYQSIGNIAAQAEVGYKLSIETTDQKQYESTFQHLGTPAVIDSVYARYVEIIDEESNAFNDGLQFFVDAHTVDGQTGYFRYEWESTGLVRVPFPSFFHIPEGEYYPVRREVPLGTCYRQLRSSEVLYATTKGTGNNRLLEFPIRYVPADSQDIRLRYSILVRQYAISPEQHQFLKKLKENNESSGSLFDKERGTVSGNISSITNPSETVLGFFEVSYQSSYRIFINRNDFPVLGSLRFPGFCARGNAKVVFAGAAYEYLQTYPDRQIWALDYSIAPMVAYAIIFDKSCTSCGDYADTEKPEFWID